MVAKIPLLEGSTDTTSHMAWGFNANIASWSPYHGALYAVTESVCKIVASGAHIDDIRLTLQEYFEKLGTDPSRWGKPFAALLGAFTAQNELRIGAIGGKDSMSGTFNDIDVPPTLVSFAVAPGKATLTVSPEFKDTGSDLYLVTVPRDADHIPDFETLKTYASILYALNTEGKINAIHSLAEGGLAVGLSKMAFGNKIGVNIETNENLFEEKYFNWIIEVKTGEEIPSSLNTQKLGITHSENFLIINGEKICLDTLIEAWSDTLEPIYPTKAEVAHTDLETFTYNGEAKTGNCKLITGNSRPRVIIPCFPGTNSEYDSAKMFNEAGADAHISVFRNLTSKHVEESLAELAKQIRESQILMIPGGFSAGDEPDGSGKFIATVLRNPQVADAVMDLLKNRDGLILGICNGFQALIKTGLVPYGEINNGSVGVPPASATSYATNEATPNHKSQITNHKYSASPTLTFNDIGRHIACYASTRIASTMSPWLAHTQVGDLYNIPFSHGEGKFIASEEDVKALAANGQIATQYTDLTGNPSMAIEHNPNGSVFAIEGITSPCGRVLGKMGHTERRGTNVAKNIPGNKHQPLFKAGVEYFI
jgi:phosphoribosylformylglycinamidine synthase